MKALNSITGAVLVCAVVTVFAGCSKDGNPTAPATGTISGRVTDSANGNPISGAMITTQLAIGTVTTDGQGRYTLSDISPDSCTVNASKTGYAVNWVQVLVSDRDTTTANIVLAATQGHQAGEEHDFPLGNASIAMCWIPAGNFQMGSPDEEQGRQGAEGPVHRVTFTDGFWMGKHEVTQSQWQAVMGSNPASGYGVGANYPVYNISWNDIQTFEQRLGGIFRLPSESGREYACRAGTTTRFYWGDDPDYSEIGNHAWYVGNSGNSTHPVGAKGSNAWGLFDMSGNVWEWCEDWFHNDYAGAPADGMAWVTPSGTDRVMRGGSWKCPDAGYSRSARRLWRNPTYRDNYIGFRLVRIGD